MASVVWVPASGSRRPAESTSRSAGVGVLRGGAGPAMLLSSSAAVQAAAALSVGVFAHVAVFATSGLRFLVAAVLLLALVRPRVRSRSRNEWAGIAALGAVAAMMNVAFYEAVDRLPLGNVVTIEFLGPLAIAVLASRRPFHLACAALAGCGVVLLAGPSLHASPIGLAFAGLAAVAEGTYLLLSNRVAGHAPGFEGLSLSVGFAALLTLPVSLPAIGGLSTGDLGSIALSGGLGIALAYVLEMQALRFSGPRAVGVLFSLDPAVGAVVGFAFLAQALSAVNVAGIVAVIIAGILTTATTSRPDTPSQPPAAKP